jgi:hypothetical protein
MDDGTKIRATCQSVSECSFVPKFWRASTDKEWTAKRESDVDNKTEDDVSGVALAEDTRLLLSPSFNHRRRGSGHNATAATRFHEDLKTDDLDGMVAMFQAKAEESISVIMSPWPGNSNPTPGPFETREPEETSDSAPAAPPEEAPPSDAAAAAKRYEIVLGGNHNTTTSIRRFVYGNGKKSRTNAFVKIPSRVCRGFGGEAAGVVDDDGPNDVSWTSYWVCLSNTRLCVGMGKIPGKQCFGVMEEEEEQQQQQQPQAETEESQTPSKEASGEAETAANEGDKGKETSSDTKFLPIRYVGIGNKDSIVEVKNLVVTNVPPCLEGLLKDIPTQDDLPIVCLAPASSSSSGMDIDEDVETLELKKYMEDYKAECQRRKQRAKKYGTGFKEVPLKDFLPWTMAKRLQKGKHNSISSVFSASSPSSSGFVAGDIDFLDPKEISKREARLARFSAKPSGSDGDGENAKGGESNGVESASVAVPPREGLPIEQAWDKEAMLRPIRRDPPPYMWKESPSNLDTLKTTKAPDPFSMYDETTKAATWIVDKLHISSIDWAAFKQIRNDDLIKHLEAYGPIKYIEWLGDVSCNVCFANKASASRALVCLSNELQSPPPEPKAKAAATTKTEESDAGLPTEPDTAAPTPAAAPPSNENSMLDLGCMTWRFGKRPIRKLSNDRHGRKGTTARYLLRVATTEDVLMDRPNSWPEPPGGFAPDRVLGPKSDYASANNKKKKTKQKQHHHQRQQQKKSNSQQQQLQNKRGNNSKRKRGRGENSGSQNNKPKKGSSSSNNNKKPNNPVDLLNRGLSSSRGGFSVEEMEKERQAKKRQKTS